MACGDSINRLPFSRESNETSGGLEEPFSVEEVYATLLELEGDKAHNLDGFLLAF